MYTENPSLAFNFQEKYKAIRNIHLIGYMYMIGGRFRALEVVHLCPGFRGSFYVLNGYYESPQLAVAQIWHKCPQ